MKKQGATALSFDTISASGIRSAMPHGIATDKKSKTEIFLLWISAVFSRVTVRI